MECQEHYFFPSVLGFRLRCIPMAKACLRYVHHFDCILFRRNPEERISALSVHV